MNMLNSELHVNSDKKALCFLQELLSFIFSYADVYFLHTSRQASYADAPELEN